MMRARLTYVPLEVADQFEDFIIERDEQVLDAVRARTRDYSTLTLLKLLYQLRGNPMTFSDLYSKSKIRENLDAEIFDICLNEAKEKGHSTFVIDTTKGIKKEAISQLIGEIDAIKHAGRRAQ